MAKKDKKNSEISSSGTLRISRDQFKEAYDRQDQISTGTSGPDFVVGDSYTGKIVKLSKGESKGAVTAGATNYRTEVELEGGEYTGRKANVFVIAHPNTSTGYMKFVTAVLGIAPEDFPTDSEGYVELPEPTESQLDQYIGKTVTVAATRIRPRQDKPQYNSTDFDFVPEAGKKKKKDKSKIAE